MPNDENTEMTQDEKPVKISDVFVRARLTEAIKQAVNELIKQYQTFFEELVADSAVLYDFLKSNDMTLEEFENIDFFDFMEKFDSYAEKHSDIATIEENTKSTIETFEELTSIQNDCIVGYIENSQKKFSGKLKVPINKLANVLDKIDIDGEEHQIAEEKRGSEKQLNTYVTFDFDEAAKIANLGNNKFSEFDKQVLEAVISLMCDGNKYITIQMIYRVLAHDQSETPTKKWSADIAASMKKFDSVKATINLDELISEYPELKEIKHLCLCTRLLKYDTMFAECRNGHKVLTYVMADEMPIIFRIAKAQNNRIATIDVNKLSFEETELSKSKDFMTLNNYLIKRIAIMRNSNVSRNILFTTIYDTMHKETEKEKRTTKKNTKIILDLLKKRNYISDFTVEKERAKEVKVKIML